jgi:hypothetical protein
VKAIHDNAIATAELDLEWRLGRSINGPAIAMWRTKHFPLPFMIIWDETGPTIEHLLLAAKLNG